MLFMFGDPLERKFVLKSRPVVVVVGAWSGLGNIPKCEEAGRHVVHVSKNGQGISGNMEEKNREI